MPIYEFYCKACNTIFSFFFRTINVSAQPACPKCGRALKREVSLFSCVGRAKEDGPDDLPIDESRLEQAMTSLASEAEHLNEDDPRQAADLMRRFTKLTGMKLGDGMQEALARIEAGEDPEQIEQEMGDLLEAEDPFAPAQKGRRSKKEPHRDETLYEL